MIFPLKPLLSLVIYQPAMFDDTVAGMIPSTAEKLTSSQLFEPTLGACERRMRRPGSESTADCPGVHFETTKRF